MKIASILTGFSSGGAEMLAKNLSLEFVRRGHDCHLVVLAEAADLGNSPEYSDQFKSELRNGGISFEVLGGATRRNPLLGAIRLRRSLARVKPDILHVHTAHGLLFQAIGFIRAPTVYTHHNIRLNFPAALFRLFDRFVHRYVAIGDACEELLRTHVRKPVELIVNGVPRGFARGGVRATLPADATVLSVGALSPQKDYPTLIQAAAICVARMAALGKSIRFRIAGSGGDIGRIEQAIDRMELGGNVELLGTRSDVGRLMAEADLLVNSSIYEGLPIALIEGAMSGLPIVATDVGGNGEIVRDGETGFLVPPGQPELLAERILRLLGDEALYAAFSEKARAWSERFDLESCAKAHLDMYAAVLGDRRRAPEAAAPREPRPR